MNKKAHSIFPFVLLLVFCITCHKLYAQTERELITSGDYYWGQSVAEDEEMAKTAARDDLMIFITNDLQKDIKMSPNSDVLVNGIKYLTKPRGPRFLALAYIDKKNVEFIMRESQLNISEIKYEDTKEQIDAELSMNNDKQNNQSSYERIENIVIIETSQAGSEKDSTISVTTNHADHDNKLQNMKPAAIRSEENISITGSSNEILTFLIQSDNISDVSRTLTNARNRGLLQFGRNLASNLNLHGSYLIVYDPDNGQIVAILDKDSSNRRLNLKSNVVVEDFFETFKNMDILWLQIF